MAAAFDFATVSGCDQLVVGPTHTMHWQPCLIIIIKVTKRIHGTVFDRAMATNVVGKHSVLMHSVLMHSVLMHSVLMQWPWYTVVHYYVQQRWENI